jgi:hypothetical protein
LKNALVFLFFIFCFLPCHIKAQDSLRIKKNQVFVEALGNNFCDPNSSADAGLASINYSRKVIFKSSSLMLSLGVGPINSEVFDPVKAEYKMIKILDLPAGILWRRKYKRNGFWVGAFFTPTIGKIDYPSNSGNGAVHNVSFQITPNISYQFQSKSENFFCRFSFTPKILASNFSKVYGDRQPIVLFLGGISIGGAW